MWIGLPSLTTRTSEWGKKAAGQQPILQMSAARWVNVPTAYADYAPRHTLAEMLECEIPLEINKAGPDWARLFCYSLWLEAGP